MQEILLSISRANCFKKCPRNFYYKYIKQIQERQQRAAALGTFFHDVMDFWAGYFKEGVSLKKSMQQAYLDKVQGRGATKKFEERTMVPYELTMDDRSIVKQWLKDYIKFLEADKLPIILGHEETFELKIGEFLVRGAIDRIDDLDEKTIRIVDYKVGSSRFIDNKQVSIYAKALINKPFYRNRKIIGTYVFLSEDCKVKEYEISDDDIAKTTKFLIDMGQGIQNETHWKPIVTPLCGWCSYKFQCAKDNNNGTMNVFE